jgi:two-component sensor histidine kinase
MKVIQLLTRQLGGKLNFYNDGGSVFEVPFIANA